MGRWIFGAVALAGAALLAACDGSVGLTETSGAVLCPGGRNCPESEDWVGMLVEDDAFLAVADNEVSFASLAVTPPTGTTAQGQTPGQGQGEAPQQGGAAAPPDPPEKRLCPQRPGKCAGPFAVYSGMMWPTPKGAGNGASPQVNCEPGSVCVKGEDGNPVSASDGEGGTMTMESGYYGWLCNKTKGDCSELPQRR